MIRTQVYIPEDLYHDLELLAATNNKNMSELIRDGAREVIKKESKKRMIKTDPWKNFIGAIKTKVKTNAVEDIHEYYEKYVI